VSSERAIPIEIGQPSWGWPGLQGLRSHSHGWATAMLLRRSW
jgi:hypothetical protein